MPKLVDHDERRHEIARALWSVVARGGFEAASARTVAAEGDWSLGALRHYFSSQDELVEFAARELIDGAAARIATVLETMPAGLPRCRMALEQLLPLDDVRRGEVRAWLAILVKAEVSPSLAELREVALFITHYVGWPLGQRVNKHVEMAIAKRAKKDAESAGD